MTKKKSKAARAATARDNAAANARVKQAIRLSTAVVSLPNLAHSLIVGGVLVATQTYPGWRLAMLIGPVKTDGVPEFRAARVDRQGETVFDALFVNGKMRILQLADGKWQAQFLRLAARVNKDRELRQAIACGHSPSTKGRAP